MKQLSLRWKELKKELDVKISAYLIDWSRPLSIGICQKRFLNSVRIQVRTNDSVYCPVHRSPDSIPPAVAHAHGTARLNIDAQLSHVRERPARATYCSFCALARWVDGKTSLNHTLHCLIDRAIAFVWLFAHAHSQYQVVPEFLFKNNKKG